MTSKPTGSPQTQSSPGPSKAQGHPHKSLPGRLDTLRIPPVTDAVQSPAPKERQKARNAAITYVSLLWPAGRRSCWWYLATCRTCGKPHLGRARSLDQVTRERRLPCGHTVTIMIARTYGRPDGGP